MSFKEKVQKVVWEMNDGKMPELVAEVKNKALKQILDEVPAKIEELFNKRLKEVDKLIQERVKHYLESNKEDS